LANGADATKVTNKGNTPLHTAASKGHKEIIEALLQRVSLNKLSDFINAKTIVKGTASLHVATENSFFEAVKSLLKHGAIYNIKNKEGKIPLDLSRDQNITNLLKLVEELFENAKNGNVEIISKLKAIKPDERVAVTNARNDQDKSLVQVAVINKHSNLASRLLEILKSPDQSLQDVSVENRVKSLKL
ncbi:MAG: ankyrin repeat domain-containing protein, partial [Wolbachia endosymbiont of Homalodisca vitripennis]|nr:ankyrin repeat domain-containing protein [Wolbachia endosymbiont of Homalodisca vitripennis]MCJ7476500.1 ankyrin repeat domain-containing protein [Wolbachia endosymbiont of Homalodisca vitripennis]